MSEIEGLLAGAVGLVCFLWAYHTQKKNSEISALKKRLATQKEEKAKSQTEPPLSNPSKPQSPAVRRLLERTLDEKGSKHQPKARIPSLWKIDIPEQSEAPKPKRPHYDPNVWEEIDGKLVLKDKSDEAKRRREASVKLAQDSIPRRTVCLPPNSIVIHSDPRD